MTRPRRLPTGLAAGAILLSLFFVFDHTREDSLSADEPVHILAGYLNVWASNAIVNIEHPPLMKILAGFALRFLPLPPPPERVPLGESFTRFGHAFLFENRVSPDAIAAAARAPFLLVLAGVLILAFVAGRGRYGTAPPACAAAVLAFDPNLVAHAGVVHTDVGAAFFFLASVLAWERARKRPTPFRIGLAALVLGLAFATKFSTVYLVPILLLQTLLAGGKGAGGLREMGAALGRLALAGAGAVLVLFFVYWTVTQRVNPQEQHRVIEEMVGMRGAPGLARRIQHLASWSPALGHYAGGLASVARQNAVGGGVNYLNGRISTTGFPEYFFVAFLVKSTIAFLLLTALAIWGARRWRLKEETRLFLLPVGVLFLASINAGYNIGIRHLLPVYPFLALSGAAVIAKAREGPKEGRGARAAAWALVLLPALSLAELVRIHPHELSYFNPAAGGPEKGGRILSDSNVDWGLDLRRLGLKLSRENVQEPTVAYFGGDDVPYRVGVPDFSADPRVRGRRVVLSAFHLAVGPEFYAYHGAHRVATALEALRAEATRRKPVGRVGYSLYLFDLEPETPGGEATR
ncbi:MAG: ArnT family glycosyltransferase [Thermoanaerobaculia bacterium]